jgi:hypothetical protein
MALFCSTLVRLVLYFLQASTDSCTDRHLVHEVTSPVSIRSHEYLDEYLRHNSKLLKASGMLAEEYEDQTALLPQ